MGDKTGGFDVKFLKLPPELQVKVWTLSLDADTSKVNLAYQPGTFVTGLTYNYGAGFEASLMIRRFSTKIGANPSNGNVDLGLAFRGFTFAASTNWKQPNLGIGLTYGASLLPFPNELTSSFNSAGIGLQNMARDLGSAPNNPLGWYGLHSNDATAIRNAISAGQQISKYGKDSNAFGFGLRLNYLPQTGLTIYGGAQYTF